jgi:hypothetical protein
MDNTISTFDGIIEIEVRGTKKYSSVKNNVMVDSDT